jgi:hypothetical protein
MMMMQFTVFMVLHQFKGGPGVNHYITFIVPAIIVANNIFMNSVDRMDQRRATNPTHQKEQQMHMSLFAISFLLVAWGEKEDYIWLHKVWKRVHVNCYTAIHFQGALNSDTVAFADMVMSTEGPLPRV